MKPNKFDLTTCLSMICDPDFASNPIAWFMLEKAGMTRELLAQMVADGAWGGSPPLFDEAPDRDSLIWKLMQERAEK